VWCDEPHRRQRVVTYVALILVDEKGENCIAVAGGANTALEPGHVRESLQRLGPGPGDVVLVGHEIPTVAASEALRYAKAAGSITVFNPAPATSVDSEMLALSDVLTPNEGEAAQLAGHDDEHEALGGELLARIAGGGHVLITLGSRGAVLVGRDGSTVLPAPEVAVVDTVGAGDTLNGSIAAGLAAGLPITEAARRAVAAASLAVARPGAREGMPTARELEAALAG